ncbi:hypothetical protein ACFO3D_17955 [Virgibacillus kekensis]|uniref:Uncharacterized protein n=1 Tax=Virgibacillus kekensis TaxID=202261 RepID=A0ABV9DPD3_9BACI
MMYYYLLFDMIQSFMKKSVEDKFNYDIGLKVKTAYPKVLVESELVSCDY